MIEVKLQGCMAKRAAFFGERCFVRLRPKICQENDWVSTVPKVQLKPGDLQELRLIQVITE